MGTQEVVNLAGLGVTVVLSIFGILVSYLVARKYGDLAGAKAADEYERQRESKRTIRILKALILETKRAKQVAKHNAVLAENESPPRPRGFIEFRLAPFDIVFSGEVGLSDKAMEVIGEFLLQAEHVNSLLLAFRSPLPTLAIANEDDRTAYLERVKEYCGGVDGRTRIPELLEELGNCLSEELKARQGRI